MLRAKASLVRAVGSDIGRVFTRSFGRSWGVVKDLHFGWFVIVPVMSSAGSVTLGTALDSALWMAPSIAFLAALTFFGTSSLLNSRVIPRLTQHWSDRLLGLFADRLPRVFPRRAGTYLYLRPLPERPRPTGGFQPPQRVPVASRKAPRPPGHSH